MDFFKTFYEDENLYLAGPMCFYPNGDAALLSVRRMAEAQGFKVALPNGKDLQLEEKAPQAKADAIFQNCADSINESTAILVNLECFRGAEPDGGSIYELGMAYARNLRCYAYSRDMRSAAHKYPYATLRGDVVYDIEGQPMDAPELPYAPCIVGSSKLVEGDLADCLQVLRQDIDQERKAKAMRMEPAVCHQDQVTRPAGDKPLVYLAGQQRHAGMAEEYTRLKELCAALGWEAVSPLDDAPGVNRIQSEDPLTRAYNTFDHWQQHVRNCDIIIADLNDCHGWEPDSNVSFEAGMAWQLGKTCLGFMSDTTVMQKRIPHHGEDMDKRDWCGNNVEDFDYPLNLMFSSSMPILEGNFESVIHQAAEKMKK